jgi:hypothetical protein
MAERRSRRTENLRRKPGAENDDGIARAVLFGSGEVTAGQQRFGEAFKKAAGNRGDFQRLVVLVALECGAQLPAVCGHSKGLRNLLAHPLDGFPGDGHRAAARRGLGQNGKAERTQSRRARRGKRPQQRQPERRQSEAQPQNHDRPRGQPRAGAQKACRGFQPQHPQPIGNRCGEISHRRTRESASGAGHWCKTISTRPTPCCCSRRRSRATARSCSRQERRSVQLHTTSTGRPPSSRSFR